MMFGVVFRVIGSNVEEISVLASTPWDFGHKFQICVEEIFRK